MGTPQDLRAAGPALRRTLRAVRPHLRPHRKIAAGGMLAMLFEVAFRLLEPWPVKVIVDRVTTPDATLASVGVLVLVAMGVATVLAALGRAVANYLATVAFALAGSRTATTLRGVVFGHVQRLSIRQHGALRTGDLVQRLIGDVGRLQEVAVSAGLPLLGNVVTFAAMLGVMIWLDPLLALIGSSGVVAFVQMSRRRTGDITVAARKTRKSEGELATQVAESVGALPTVQAFQLEDQLERGFSSSNQRSLKDGVKARRLAAALERRTDVVVAIGTASVLGFGGWRVLTGALTPGELVVFLTYLKSAMKPMRDLAKYTGRIAKAAAAGERVVDLLDTEPEILDHAAARHVERVSGELTFEGVHLAYEVGAWAVHDVDLHIAAGERVALIGPSGGGKSSIAALTQRLIDPTRGRILADGHDLTDLTLTSWRAQVAVVPQEPVLFAATIRDNLRYGREDATDEELVAAAEAAGADAFVRDMPDGYDTVLRERGSSLSGGQRQRLAIARALLRDAPIVVLDEATGSVDPDNEAAIRAALARLTAGRTTITITHDHDALDDADRVLWVEAGRVRDVTARFRGAPRSEVLRAVR